MAAETETPAQNPTEAASSQATTSTTETTATSLVTGAEVKQDAASSTETQPTEKTTEAAKTETKTEAPGAPEKYEFANADKYDANVLGVFSEAAKEANLSQDAAQKFLEKTATALEARTQERVAAVQKEWMDTSTADKEFGGEKFKENLGIAKQGLNVIDPIPEGQKTTPLRTLLETTGLGNHPEIIRALFHAGQRISEDKFVTGSASGRSTADAASVLYDNTPKG